MGNINWQLQGKDFDGDMYTITPYETDEDNDKPRIAVECDSIVFAEEQLDEFYCKSKELFEAIS